METKSTHSIQGGPGIGIICLDEIEIDSVIKVNGKVSCRYNCCNDRQGDDGEYNRDPGTKFHDPRHISRHYALDECDQFHLNLRSG